MLRVNAINRQELLKCLTFNPKSLVFKTVSVPTAMSQNRSFCAHFALFVQFISCRIDNNQVFHSEADTFPL